MHPFRMRPLLSGWHVYLPVLFALAILLPHIGFLIPAHTDLTDECYQPLRTLKFFKNRGAEFHKYGPMPNFLLAIPYGAALAYWKITGALGSPSDTFPYGFARPLQQLGQLVLVGRILFTLIGLGFVAHLAWTLRREIGSKFAVFTSLMILVVGNPYFIWKLPIPEVDSPMLAFGIGAIACYASIILGRLTKWKVLCLVALGVFAVSSKELAAPLIGAMGIGTLVVLITSREMTVRAKWIVVVQAALTGAVLFAAINVVYAPRVWFERMEYWIAGEGLDGAVWGNVSGYNRLLGVAGALISNLGVGGAVAGAFLVIAAIPLFDRRVVLLLLPTVAFLMTVVFVPYVPHRFYSIGLIALAPAFAVTYEKLLKRTHAAGGPGWHRAVVGAGLLLVVLNLWYVSITWEWLRRNEYSMAEQHAVSSVDRNLKVCHLLPYSIAADSSRLNMLGFKVETRSASDWIKTPAKMPDVIYISARRYQYILDAKARVARSEMMERQTGFDAARFQRLDELNYNVTRITKSAPWLAPFRFIPAVKELPERDLLVFRRVDK